ncbi:MAG TPA: cupredoxin domain-containing protein [Candidatus Paceibacterota bacterium]|nr:cupredoxin domain-containing protein [Candidatus Paceibacterota bacterium]
MSNRQKTLALVVAALVIVAAGAWVWISYDHNGTEGGSGGSVATGTPTSATRAPVPAGTVVPNEGATDTPAGVAVPAVQSIGDPSGNTSYRSFNITAQGGTFSPATIAVNEGDTVDLEITAADAAYSFTQPDYGFNAAIAKGKTQRIQFQALQTGDFIFYCGSCGGPAKGPVGHIIVTAKQ